MLRTWSTPLKVVVIIIFALSSIAFCSMYQDKKMKDNKVVEWGAKLSSASYTLYKQDNFRNLVNLQKSDKVQDYSTSFYLDNGTWLRSLDGGTGRWGYGATPLGGNKFEQPLPDKIRVTYLDDMTNQYYQGEHPLPKDNIYSLMTSRHRKMLDSNPRLIESGLKRRNYTYIELAFAPKGWVVVFVTGRAGRVEVTSFQASPIEPDPKTLEGRPISSGDEYLYLSYKAYQERKKINDYHLEFKNAYPDAYKKWQSGEWRISSDWYKKVQTKYPWNLSVTIDGQYWNGEYYAQFANTERYAILDDQFDYHNKQLKSVPHTIKIWAVNPETDERTGLEVHLYPRPRWSAKALRDSYYQPYYQDPNLNRFLEHFESLYPTRSLSTNNQPANPNDFATLQLDFNKDLILKNSYLIKDDKKIALEGAYQFSKAPIDPTQGQFITERGYPIFLTEPKLDDLSDPAFVEID